MTKTLYRHKKRGTTYRIIADVTMQCSGPGEHLVATLDDKPIVVYQDVDTYKLWARLKSEFFDGRFEELTDER